MPAIAFPRTSSGQPGTEPWLRARGPPGTIAAEIEETTSLTGSSPEAEILRSGPSIGRVPPNRGFRASGHALPRAGRHRHGAGIPFRSSGEFGTGRDGRGLIVVCAAGNDLALVVFPRFASQAWQPPWRPSITPSPWEDLEGTPSLSAPLAMLSGCARKNRPDARTCHRPSQGTTLGARYRGIAPWGGGHGRTTLKPPADAAGVHSPESFNEPSRPLLPPSGCPRNGAVSSTPPLCGAAAAQPDRDIMESPLRLPRQPPAFLGPVWAGDALRVWNGSEAGGLAAERSGGVSLLARNRVMPGGAVETLDPLPPPPGDRETPALTVTLPPSLGGGGGGGTAALSRFGPAGQCGIARYEHMIAEQAGTSGIATIAGAAGPPLGAADL